MEMGKAATRAKNKYNGANYDRIALSVPKGDKERYKAAAEARGMSLNQFIIEAIEQQANKPPIEATCDDCTAYYSESSTSGYCHACNHYARPDDAACDNYEKRE